jgi:hypothetical protein
MKQVQGQSAWISYGGLKGGGNEEEWDPVWATINFELKQHHMWVHNTEHIRDIMLRKRYNKAAVAPAGLNGKLEGQWRRRPVIKLICRPDVKGVPVRFPKEAGKEWNPESGKVTIAVRYESERIKVKEVPCEMPLKKGLERFHFDRKKVTVRSTVIVPWMGWTEPKVKPREGMIGEPWISRERKNGQLSSEAYWRKEEEKRKYEADTKRELDAMEEGSKNADDQELRDFGEKLEKAARREKKTPPPGEIVIKLLEKNGDYE